MTLFSYEIFDAVARQGSFNKAAQQLHLTPSAISHAIAVMEAELGFTLFNRGKNGVTMTSYGASLYPSIRAVLNSDEALQQSIARLNGLEKGKVKLGAFNSICSGLLPSILKGFMAHYPQIEVEVYQGTYDDVKEWLRTGQVDIAFLSNNCREEFVLTELFHEPLLCITPMDWPEPPNGVMTPALMNGQNFVVQWDATDAEMRQFLTRHHLGECYEGIISGVTQRGIFVELENGVEGFVPASSLTATGTTLTEGIRLSDPASGKTWSLGDSMMITIVRADINLGKVDFEVAPETK